MALYGVYHHYGFILGVSGVSTEAVAIGLLLDIRPSLWVCIEQPAQSWAYKQTFMIEMICALQLFLDLMVLQPLVLYRFCMCLFC